VDKCGVYPQKLWITLGIKMINGCKDLNNMCDIWVYLVDVQLFIYRIKDEHDIVL
jgi:hypothetical protein